VKIPPALRTFVLALVFFTQAAAFYFAAQILKWPSHLDLFLKRSIQETYYQRSGSSDFLNHLTVISIDDASYSAVAMKWPWPRVLMAGAIEKLAGMGPKAILFDYTMIGRSAYGEEDDSRFAQALKNAGNVILSSYFTMQGPEIRPLGIFQNVCAGTGYINVPIEIDERVYSYWPFLADSKGKVAAASLPLSAFLFSRGLGLEDVVFNWTDHQFRIQELSGHTSSELKLPIFFRAKPKDFNRVSFVDVLNGKVSEKDFRNRIVLIGNDGLTFRELLKTPLGFMSGVYVIGNELLNLIEGFFIEDIQSWKTRVFTWGTIFLCVWLFLRLSFVWALLFFVLMTCFYISFIYFAFLQGLSWNFSDVWILVLEVFLAVYSWRLFQYFRLTSRVKKEAVTDWLTHTFTYRYFRFMIQNSWDELNRSGKALLILCQIQDISENKMRDVSAALKSLFPGKSFWARYSQDQMICLARSLTISDAISLLKLREKETSSSAMTFGIAWIERNLFRGAWQALMAAETALKKALKKGECCEVFNRHEDALPSSAPAEDLNIHSSVSNVEYLKMDLEMREKELAQMKRLVEQSYVDKIRSERLAAAGEMAAKFHHEINNPIASIQMGMTVLKEEGIDPAERKKMMDIISSEIQRLSRLAKQMLDFFRPANETKITCSVTLILEDVLNLSALKFSARGVKVNKHFTEDLPHVLCSPDQIKQVILNLVLNAIDAMPKGGALDVSASLKSARQGDFIEIGIRDTGTGIPEEVHDKIFTAFFTTKGEKGTGLGLSTCYNILKAHNGTIDFKSRAGEGTEFTIRLPVLKGVAR